MKKQQDNNTQNKKFRILLGILILWLMCGQTLWAQTTNKYYSIALLSRLEIIGPEKARI